MATPAVSKEPDPQSHDAYRKGFMIYDFIEREPWRNSPLGFYE